MPKDEDFVGRDNLFHRRMSDVRNRVGINSINEAEALEMVKNAGKPSIFSQPQVQREDLSDDDIDRRAFFDKDTPTYNFRYMLRSLRRELTRARRYKRPLSVCVVVIDKYADLFYQYGVIAGESVINASSETLIRACRADVDMVGRYGEDRFLLILPETPIQGATILSERIRAKFEQLAIQSQWNKIKLTCSIGIAQFPDANGIEEIIAHAEIAAEVAMETGGNQVIAGLE
ncbi:MAG TPA: GGDEF domain-containing protein [Drouetiella sp.]